MLIQIILLTLASGMLSLFGAYLLARKKNWKQSFSLQLTAFSSGVLLAAAFLQLAPEALHELEEMGADNLLFPAMFAAIVLFFVLERLVLWFHHHHEVEGPKPAAYLIMTGDTLHNFIDGVLIASVFLISPELGIITAIAVAVHEVPQEIADFSVMVAAGVRKRTALILNALSALAAVLGGVLTWFVHDQIESYLPLAIAFAAGMFIYIALSDLIPELHHHTKENAQKWVQLGLFGLGVLVIVAMAQVLPDPHDFEEYEDQDDDDVAVVRVYENDRNA
jgi:zinc and cadmium transporter